MRIIFTVIPFFVAWSFHVISPCFEWYLWLY